MNMIYLRQYEYKYYSETQSTIIPLTSEMPQNNIKSKHSANNYESIRFNRNYVTHWDRRNSRTNKTGFLPLVNSESNGEDR